MSAHVNIACFLTLRSTVTITFVFGLPDIDSLLSRVVVIRQWVVALAVAPRLVWLRTPPTRQQKVKSVSA